MSSSTKEIEKIMSQQDWIDALKKGTANCYIKPNRYVHDSGFRCFEVGYLIMGNDRKCEAKLILSKYSDHIQLYNYVFEPNLHTDIMPNMDIMLDGHIRIWEMDGKPIWWGSLDFVVSSAQLKSLI